MINEILFHVYINPNEFYQCLKFVTKLLDNIIKIKKLIIELNDKNNQTIILIFIFSNLVNFINEKVYPILYPIIISDIFNKLLKSFASILMKIIILSKLFITELIVSVLKYSLFTYDIKIDEIYNRVLNNIENYNKTLNENSSNIFSLIVLISDDYMFINNQ